MKLYKTIRVGFVEFNGKYHEAIITTGLQHLDNRAVSRLIPGKFSLEGPVTINWFYELKGETA